MRRPFQGECIAPRSSGIAVTFYCPGVYEFIVPLSDRCECREAAFHFKARFLFKFSLRGGERVPTLVLFFGMSQHLAQGTTLALLVPPIGILAAWQYYREGYVDLHVAGLICLGFVIGGLAGAKMATSLSNTVLERIFGAALLLISLKMIFAK